MLGRDEEALVLQREVYSVGLKLFGEHEHTLRAANNYAVTLRELKRFEEARTLLRKTVPVARRILGDTDSHTLNIRWGYAEALYLDDSATLDDLREAVANLEDVERIARRVFGGEHPTATAIGRSLREARAALRARETPSVAT